MSNEEQEEPGWMQIVLFFIFNLIFPARFHLLLIFSGMRSVFARGSNLVVWMFALFLFLFVKITCSYWGQKDY